MKQISKTKYEWAEDAYSILLTIPDEGFIKCYGPVNLKNKINKYWRNYKRPLKTSNAMSFVDLLNNRINQNQKRIKETLTRNLFG